MSKEWDKFSARFKKLEPKIKMFQESNAEAASKRFTLAYANGTEGAGYIADTMVDARKRGVTGSTLADFMKDAGFKEAIKLYENCCKNIEKEQIAFQTYCNDAAALSQELTKFRAEVEKDLKSRKDKSATKQDIEGLRDLLTKEIGTLGKAAKRYSNLSPGKLNYVKNQKKTIDSILKQAPAEQAKSKDDSMLPQQLQDRLIKSNFNKAVIGEKEVAKLCEEALNKAQKDLKAAAPILKNAGAKVIEIKKLSDTYQKIVKDYPLAINDSKDKAKILKMIKAISDSYTNAQRKLHGTATTIKKAG